MWNDFFFKITRDYPIDYDKPGEIFTLPFDGKKNFPSNANMKIFSKLPATTRYADPASRSTNVDFFHVK